VIRLPSGVQAPPLESGDPALAIEHQPAHRTRLVTDPKTLQLRCMPVPDHADDEDAP
jgi:hypothetical protein